MRWIVILAATACLTGQAAFAHAFLDRASPAAGSEVSGSLAAVTLTYSEPVEPLFSSIQVTDGNGARVDTGKPSGRGDRRTLSVGLLPVTAGVYIVEWHVTSLDTHKTEGHFSFTVKP